MISRRSKALVEVYDKGYRVSKSGVLTNPQGKELRLSESKGYYDFSVRIEGGVVKVKVHRLQAYQKYGAEMLKKGIVCRHLDSDPKNNSFDNIAIGTQSENMMDMKKEKRRLNASNPKHKHLSIVKDYYVAGLSYTKLMEKYSIKSKGTISHIVNKSLTAENFLKQYKVLLK